MQRDEGRGDLQCLAARAPQGLGKGGEVGGDLSLIFNSSLVKAQEEFT